MGSDCGPDRHLTSSHKRAKNLKLLLCVLSLGTVLASLASAQVVEGYIQLPDSFGVFDPPYQVAVDYAPGAERLFVIGESSEVLVVDAISFQKLKRIPILARSICYSSVQNKLYVAELASTSLDVVDGSTYEVVKQVPLGDNAEWLFYNPIVDRVYCGTYRWRVLDCTSDSIVDTLQMNGRGRCRTLDSLHNKLYSSADSGLMVLDCSTDSVVATIDRIPDASSLCYSRTGDRVYATAQQVFTEGETLYAVDTQADSVIARSRMIGHGEPYTPSFVICPDPIHNRVFAACACRVVGFDCSGDTLKALWASHPPAYPPSGLACAPELDRVYMSWAPYVVRFDGSTGDMFLVEMDANMMDLPYLERLRSLYGASTDGRLMTLDCNTDTVRGILPLTPDRPFSQCVSIDTVDNKLYFGRETEDISYLGVVDCTARHVRSIEMCYDSRSMIHNSREDKLYVATWNGFGSSRSGVSVYDCRSDSLVKVIPVGYVRAGLQWHPGLNRAYAATSDSLGRDYIAVIDCATDSVVKVLPRGSTDDGFRCTLISPELNQYWGFSPNGYTVVDCLEDSIVMDTVTGYRLAMGASYSTADRKVYVEYTALAVFSMNSLRPIKSVPLPLQETRGELVYVAAARKLYGAVLTSSSTVTDSIYVLDTRTDSIVSRFDAGHMIGAMCEDATGRYVYCTANSQTPPWPESLLVIDTGTDSVVSRIPLPDIEPYGGEWLLPNRRTGRIYAGPGPNGRVVIIKDSVVVGMQELTGPTRSLVLPQTVVSRNVPFLSTTRAVLFDASGRRAAVLRSGPNSISHLAPGVYFVREEPQASSFKPQAVRKVVVTR